MASNFEFHQMIERLIDRDHPPNAGEMESFHKRLSERLVTSQRKLLIASLSLLIGIPGEIVGQMLVLGASKVPPIFPGWLGYLGLVLAYAGMVVVPLAAIYLLLWAVPRYLRARWDLRDSMLTILVNKVDELSRRMDGISKQN